MLVVFCVYGVVGQNLGETDWCKKCRCIFIMFSLAAIICVCKKKVNRMLDWLGTLGCWNMCDGARAWGVCTRYLVLHQIFMGQRFVELFGSAR